MKIQLIALGSVFALGLTWFLYAAHLDSSTSSSSQPTDRSKEPSVKHVRHQKGISSPKHPHHSSTRAPSSNQTFSSGDEGPRRGVGSAPFDLVPSAPAMNGEVSEKEGTTPLSADETVDSTLRDSLPLSANDEQALGLAQKFLLQSDLTIYSTHTVEFSTASLEIFESTRHATANVRLNSPSLLPIAVQYSSNKNLLPGEEDFVPVSGILKFLPGEIEKSIEISIIDDSVEEGNEFIQLSLWGAIHAKVGTRNSLALRIIDDDGPSTVALSSDQVTSPEGSQSLALVAKLGYPAKEQISVEYELIDGSAKAGEDFTHGNTLLVFQKGDLVQTLVVELIDDEKKEEDESFSIQLKNPTNASVGELSTTNVTILDNDELPAVEFGVTSVTTSEDANKLSIPVKLSNASASIVSVSYSYSDGSAKHDEDFKNANGELQFKPGESVQYLTLLLVNDDIHEEDEVFQLSLGSAQNALLGKQDTIELSILDDETIPEIHLDSASLLTTEKAENTQISCHLSKPAPQPVTVSYTTVENSAEPNTDYVPTSGVLTFAPGQLTATFSIQILDDELEEKDEVVSIHFVSSSNATLPVKEWQLTIVDDDEPPTVSFTTEHLETSEGASEVLITVLLSPPSSDSSTVKIAATAGSAEAEKDYHALPELITIPEGETKHTFGVALIDDLVAEPDEYFEIAVSLLTNVDTAPAILRITIVDDDLPIIDMGVASIEAGEGEGSIAIVLKLSSPVATQVSVAVEFESISALLSEDFEVLNTTVLFPAEATTAIISVVLLDDAIPEGDEKLIVKLATPSYAELGTQSETIIIIKDDDSPPTAHFTQTSLEVNESEGVVAASIMLSEPSELPVSFAVSIGGTASEQEDYLIDTLVVYFQPWQFEYVLNISLIDDGVLEDSETLSLSLQHLENTTSESLSSLQLTILDNDTPATVSLEHGYIAVSEGEGIIEILISQSTSSASSSIVDLVISGGLATPGEDFELLTQTVELLPEQTTHTVAIAITDDSVAEDDEYLILKLNPLSNITLGDHSEIIISIVDNDAPPVIQFGLLEASVNENAGTAMITVALTGQSDFDVSVTCTPTGGTATANDDYSTTSDTIIFLSGESIQTFEVIIFDDEDTELHETIRLQLTHPVNGELGASSVMTLVIIDDDVIHVSNSPSDHATIQAALDAASDGDTILVAPGTYSGAGNVALEFFGKEVHLRSEEGPETTVIDGQGLSGLFYLAHDETPATVIEGFTLTGGNGEYPQFPGFSSGGAIFAMESSPTIRGNVITGNSAEFDAGGIFAFLQGPSNTHIEIDGNTISDNHSLTGRGGGLCIRSTYALIQDNVISNNTSFEQGGGICVSGDDPLIRNCVISSNSTQFFGGGGLYYSPIAGGGDHVVENTLIVGNQTHNQSGGGAGVLMPLSSSGPAVFRNCTITGNVSDGVCGGIWAKGESVILENSIVWGNVGSSSFHQDLEGVQSTLSYSNVGDYDESLYAGSPGLISVDPLFVAAGASNYRLQALSPCIDAANGSLAPATDFDGDTRFDSPLVQNTGVGTPDFADIGAFEYVE